MATYQRPTPAALQRSERTYLLGWMHAELHRNELTDLVVLTSVGLQWAELTYLVGQAAVEL